MKVAPPRAGGRAGGSGPDPADQISSGQTFDFTMPSKNFFRFWCVCSLVPLGGTTRNCPRDTPFINALISILIPDRQICDHGK